VEFFALGGVGKGVPVRATVSGFGPLLLSKVLGLNETQESSLGLVFHYADANGLALVDLSDLRAVLTYLTSDDGKAELKNLGGLSAATAGVILRELITFADGGADVFFGEPEFDVNDFLRTAPTAGDDLAARGARRRRQAGALLDVPHVPARRAVRDPARWATRQAKLVFFFDEAHLLFRDASKAFLAQITRRCASSAPRASASSSTQTPKDVPADVLGQLGSRVQHALRAFTPDDAKALRATVGTYPKSGYDLERTLQELGTGEAIVTVMTRRARRRRSPGRACARRRASCRPRPMPRSMPPSRHPSCCRATARRSTASRRARSSRRR
jgi:DNA helicase HerA-like ATPase